MVDGDERAAKRRRFSSNIITLKVGTAGDTLSAHEHIIREKSEFFRAALEKHWQEGKTGVIELPDDDVDAIAEYLNWLYGGPVAKEEASREEFPYDQLVQLYVFGEKILDDAFCNAILSALAIQFDLEVSNGREWFPNCETHRMLYAGTAVGCPARRLFVTAAVERGKVSWFNRPEGDD